MRNRIPRSARSRHGKPFRTRSGLTRSFRFAQTLQVLPVLISPVIEVERSAVPHLDGLYFWKLDDFREWAKLALAEIRELRRTFTGAGDLAWRAQAIGKYREACLGPAGVRGQLRPATTALTVRG